MTNLSLPCCLLNSQYIDLSELIHVLKVVTIVTSEHLNQSTIFVVNHFLIAKKTPEWRVNPGFATQKKCPFYWIDCVPSIGETKTKIMWTFSRDQILCRLNGGVLWTEESQSRGST